MIAIAPEPEMHIETMSELGSRRVFHFPRYEERSPEECVKYQRNLRPMRALWARQRAEQPEQHLCAHNSYTDEIL